MRLGRLGMVLVATLMTLVLPGSAFGQTQAGVSLPSGISIPPKLPASLLATLQRGGALPAHISSTDFKTLLAIPHRYLPVQVGDVVAVLTHLANLRYNAPTAEQVACGMNRGLTPGTLFQDLGGVPWAQGPVAALATAGVLQGVGGGRFDPQGVLTQQQILTMLMRALGPGGAPDHRAPISGVAPWAQSAVQDALKEGLLPQGGGITLAPNSTVDRYQATVLLTRALGLASFAQTFTSQPYPFRASGPVPSWARGAVTLAERLGLAKGMSQGRFDGSAPLTRAEVAVFLARGMRLLNGAQIASGQEVITGAIAAPAGQTTRPGASLSPASLGGCSASSLEAGRTVQITGQGFGQGTGFVNWVPAQGSSGSESWPIRTWTDQVVTVHVPQDATPGKGQLIVKTHGGGSATAAITVVSPLRLRTGRLLPTGMVPVSWQGSHTAYMSAHGVKVLRHLTPLSLQQILDRVAGRLKQVDAHRPRTRRPQFVTPNGVETSQSPAFRVQLVPMTATPGPARRLPLEITHGGGGGGTACINAPCVTYYGPQTTITSPTPQLFTSTSFSASANNFCTTEYVLGAVCSSTSTQAADGSNAGGFVEIGASWGEWASVDMNSYLVAYYEPQGVGTMERVKAKVFTHQVGGGIQAGGWGCSPLDVGGQFGFYTQGVQPPLSNVTQQESKVASCLATSSIGIPTTDVPEGTASDLVTTAFSKLESAINGATYLWNGGTTVAGVLGANHATTFTWCGYVPSGERLQILLNPMAQIEQAAEIPGTQINLVKGIAMVRVTETGAAPC